MGRMARLAGLLLFVCLSGSCASAADFYQGKQIRITTGGVPGGGNDFHARVLAAHMGKHIPGAPTFIVSNMPEGGGLRVAGYTYTVAKRDGTEFSNLLRDALFAPLLGEQLAQFKPVEFNWIGTPSSYANDAMAFVVRSALPYKSVEDLRRAPSPLNVAVRGAVYPLLMKEAFGANFKFISGYRGGEDILALQRGELDGMSASFVNLQRKDDLGLKDNFVRILVQFGHENRLSSLPDVPAGQELARTPEDLALVKFSEEPLRLGSPFAAPPGVPQDRVAILQKAFMETMNDPDFIAHLEKTGNEYSPRSGEDVARLIKSVYAAPAAVVDRYKTMIAPMR